jgi:hypothetical protein
MLHAISMPQLGSASRYVQESVLVSLTPIKFESCGQPLPEYPAPGYDFVGSESDRRCRFRTESGDFRFTLRQILRASGRIDGGFLDQQCRQAVAHRIHASAGGAPQLLRIRPNFQVAFAGGTDDQVEKVLGNHNRWIVRRFERFFTTDSQRHRARQQHNNHSLALRQDDEIPAKRNLAWSFSVPLCLCGE